MFDENQLVKTKWQCGNMKRYKDMGYQYTGVGTELVVKAKDLSANSDCMINVTCDYCNKEYTTRYSIANKATKNACVECAPIKANELRRDRMSKNKIRLAKEICKPLGYTLLTTENEYDGCKGEIRFICPFHGVQVMMFENFIRGHICFKCSYKNRVKKKTAEEIIEIVNSVNGNKLLNPQDYVDVFRNNMRIKCACGREYTTSIQNYRTQNQTRCSICSQKESVAEKRIREFLDANNIKYEQEKRFVECKDKRQLPFDFYIPDYNMCIEFDGEHHFEPIYSIEHYEMTVRHDKIKNDFCSSSGIKLIRIPYWDGNNIEKIIKSQVEDIV